MIRSLFVLFLALVAVSSFSALDEEFDDGDIEAIYYQLKVQDIFYTFISRCIPLFYTELNYHSEFGRIS